MTGESSSNSSMPSVTKPSGKHNVSIGTSFAEGSLSSFHTMRYRSEPAAAKSFGKLQIRGKVAEMSVDSHRAGAATTYLGNVENHNETECVLICDNSGKWRLERLHLNMKNLRASSAREQEAPDEASRVPVQALEAARPRSGGVGRR